MVPDVRRVGKLDAKSITRSDVRALMSRIEAPVLANMVKAPRRRSSSWAVKQEILTVNPCIGRSDKNGTQDRRPRAVKTRVTQFWAAFDSAGLVRSSALKLILLTGQRPGEVSHMRREHVRDGWWEMPVSPIAKLGWPGTRTSRVTGCGCAGSGRARSSSEVDGRQGVV